MVHCRKLQHRSCVKLWCKHLGEKTRSGSLSIKRRSSSIEQVRRRGPCHNQRSSVGTVQAEQQERVELQTLLASFQPSSSVRHTTLQTDRSMSYPLHELRNDAVTAFLHAGDLSSCSSQQSSCSDVEFLSSSKWSSSVISQPLGTHAHQSQEQESFFRPRTAGHFKQSAQTRCINNCLYKVSLYTTWPCTYKAPSTLASISVNAWVITSHCLEVADHACD